MSPVNDAYSKKAIKPFNQTIRPVCGACILFCCIPCIVIPTIRLSITSMPSGL